MRKTAPNITPDWPYDMDLVIRQMGLRRRGDAQCATILTLALRMLGHDAQDVGRRAKSAALEEHKRLGRQEVYDKEQTLHGVELGGLFLSPRLARSWDESLLHMHQELGRGVDPGHDWETVFTGMTVQQGATALPDLIERTARALQACPTAGWTPSVAQANPEEAIMAEMRKILLDVFDSSNINKTAKMISGALLSQDITAHVWQQVEAEERGGVLHEIRTHSIRYGVPATVAEISDSSMPGVLKCITPSKVDHGRYLAAGDCVQNSEWDYETVDSRNNVRCAGMVNLLRERHLQQHIVPADPTSAPRLRM